MCLRRRKQEVGRADPVRGRPRRRAELLWTCIPVLIVFFLAARSWVAAFGIAGPAAASAVTASDGGRAPSQPDTSP